jgi:hypothetical protein
LSRYVKIDLNFTREVVENIERSKSVQSLKARKKNDCIVYRMLFI